MDGKEFFKIVQSRRSIRKYSDKPVSNEDVMLCIEAARLAPSACNSQPWKFVVLTGERKDAFAKEAFSGIYSVTSFAGTAPVMVAIVGEGGNFTSMIGNMVQGMRFDQVDAGIACSHIVLQAQALGLGTCIIGWFNEKKAARFLGVPSNKKMRLLVSIGFPSENPEPRPRRKLEEIYSSGAY